MGVLRFDGDDRLKWTTLATPLANTCDGAWTGAFLVKRASTGAWHSISTLLSSTGNGIARTHGGFNSGDNFIVDVGGAPKTTSTFLNTSSPYLFVISKGAGTVAPRLGWKLGSAGAWNHGPLDATLADQTGVAATMLEIGTWQTTADFFNGWIGVVAWWEGAMSDANKEALDNNWRTSDLWNSAHGQPTFLAELNVAGSSVVDLAANASSLTATPGMTLDAAETLDSWTFDGKGGTTITPAGIAHTRAQGTPVVSPQLRPAGLSHTRAQGTPAISPTLLPAGITHSRALGAPTVTAGFAVAPAGLTRTRAQGAPAVNPQLLPAGLAHTRAQGAPVVSTGAVVSPAALAHTRALGSFVVSPAVLPGSLVRSRALGALAVSAGGDAVPPTRTIMGAGT